MKDLTLLHNDQKQDKQGELTPFEMAELQNRPKFTSDQEEEFLNAWPDED